MHTKILKEEISENNSKIGSKISTVNNTSYLTGILTSKHSMSSNIIGFKQNLGENVSLRCVEMKQHCLPLTILKP